MEDIRPTQLIVDDHPLPGTRLDSYLVDYLPDESRAAITRLIRDGSITVNAKPVKAKYSPKKGDAIAIEWPEIKELDILPQDIPLDILHEDDDLIVINKQAGMVVHPAAGHPDQTIVNALLHHCGAQLSGIGGVARPGIVHRLDMDTSGCIVIAKTDAAHKNLVEQFASRTVTKIYLAILIGEIGAGVSMVVDRQIGRHPSNRKLMSVLPPDNSSGKPAKTTFVSLESGNGLTAASADLHTGRTHQIRVHAKSIGYPLLGDHTYGKKQNTRFNASLSEENIPSRQMLHSHQLSFTHPTTQQTLLCTAPIPKDIQHAKSLITH